MINQTPPKPDDIIKDPLVEESVTDSQKKEVLEKQKEVSNADTQNLLGGFNNELSKESAATILVILIAFLKDPTKFFESLFGGGKTEEETVDNLKKWEQFKDSPMIGFFEEIKDTFSLTTTNTDPEIFNKQFNDTKFKKILLFHKKSGKEYSPETLMVLWQNKDNLETKDNKLFIEKESEVAQEVDIKNDETLTKSIVSKESLGEKIPVFTEHLQAALSSHFSDIPVSYQEKIPNVVETFKQELQKAIEAGKMPRFSKQKILYAIEQNIEIPYGGQSIIETKINEFLMSPKGEKLKIEYSNLWKA